MKWTFRVNISSYKVPPSSLSHNIAGKGYIREFLIVFLISFLSFSRFERAESQVERFRKFWGGGGGRSVRKEVVGRVPPISIYFLVS